MKSSRRKFLWQTIVAGPLSTIVVLDPDDLFAQVDCTLPTPAAPSQFTPNEPKVVNRISAAEMAAPANAAQLTRFRGAFASVKALPSADVIGWQKLIAQHCINCAPSNTNNIHYNWQFLPWHRGLLYFLERILRKLPTSPGGDDLRLVYWDWENSASRTLPAIYAPTGQSLYWANRGNLSGSQWPLTNAKVDVQPLLAVPDFKSFGGTAAQGAPTPMVFVGPHANVHNNFIGGDMRDLQYSPRDPVFYAHHSNIDRLWSSWVAAGHASPDFGMGKVYFYDETRTWRYILMNDLKDESKLGYRYSSLMRPAVPANRLKTLSMNKSNGRAFALASPALGEFRTRAAAGPSYLLITNIRDLEKLPDQTRDYGLFSNKPAAGATPSPENGYVGTVSRVFSDAHNHLAPLSAALTVTGKVAALFPGTAATLNLQVVALDDNGKTTASSIPLVADSVSIVE